MLEQFKTTIRDMQMMRKKMKEQATTAGSHKCSECEGRMHARLVRGRGQDGMAMRFWCDGPCQRRGME